MVNRAWQTEVEPSSLCIYVSIREHACLHQAGSQRAIDWTLCCDLTLWSPSKNCKWNYGPKDKTQTLHVHVTEFQTFTVKMIKSSNFLSINCQLIKKLSSKSKYIVLYI